MARLGVCITMAVVSITARLGAVTVIRASKNTRN